MPWHVDEGSAVDLMVGIFNDPSTFPYSLLTPWLLLWFLPLGAVWSMVRGILGGVFYGKALWRRQALVFSKFAVIGLVWFYLAHGDNAGVPLFSQQRGDLRGGYWLAASSLTLLILLVLFEGTLPTQDPWLARLYRLPPDHPERMRAGLYRACPVCGKPNDERARRCSGCGMILFPDADFQPERQRRSP
jgi:hypothetical protein